MGRGRGVFHYGLNPGSLASSCCLSGGGSGVALPCQAGPCITFKEVSVSPSPSHSSSTASACWSSPRYARHSRFDACTRSQKVRRGQFGPCWHAASVATLWQLCTEPRRTLMRWWTWICWIVAPIQGQLRSARFWRGLSASTAQDLLVLPSVSGFCFLSLHVHLSQPQKYVHEMKLKEKTVFRYLKVVTNVCLGLLRVGFYVYIWTWSSQQRELNGVSQFF